MVRTLDSILQEKLDYLQIQHQHLLIDHSPPGANTSQRVLDTIKLSRSLAGKSELPTLSSIFPSPQSETDLFEIDALKYLRHANALERTARESILIFGENSNTVRQWTNYYTTHIDVAKKLTTIRHITDAALGAFCFLTASMQYLSNEGVSPSMVGATLLYATDATLKDKPNLSLFRTAALTVSAGPVLSYVANYITGSSAFDLEQFQESFRPLGNALLIAIMTEVYFARSINFFAYKEGKRLHATKEKTYDFFSEARKLTYTLAELRKLQSIPNAHTASEPALTDFKEACINYLLTGENREQIRHQRSIIRNQVKNKSNKQFDSTSIAPKNSDITDTVLMEDYDMPSALPEEEPEPTLFPNITSSGNIVSSDVQQTIELLRPYGISEMQSIKIGSKTTHAQALGIIERLKIGLGDRHSEVVRSNPKIILMTRDVSNDYFSHLSNAVESGASLEELATPIGVVNFTKKHGTSTALEQTPEQKYAAPLKEAGYPDFQVLQAVVVNGFRINSSRARIAMAYSKFIDIKRAARPKFKDEEMSGFDDTFAKLITDKAILTDKIGKARGAGGRFQGAYSLNPRVSDISNPTLRKFLAEAMYGRNKQ